MKIFISHKKEDSHVASQIAAELRSVGVGYYLDVFDDSVSGSGKELTNHIKANLNDCTDIIVVMSEITRFSQWVPFEVGMAAQNDMPTATFLQANISLPEFLEYWPRLKYPSDIQKYISTRYAVYSQYGTESFHKNATMRMSQIDDFYSALKRRL